MAGGAIGGRSVDRGHRARGRPRTRRAWRIGCTSMAWRRCTPPVMRPAAGSSATSSPSSSARDSASGPSRIAFAVSYAPSDTGCASTGLRQRRRPDAPEQPSSRRASRPPTSLPRAWHRAPCSRQRRRPPLPRCRRPPSRSGAGASAPARRRGRRRCACAGTTAASRHSISITWTGSQSLPTRPRWASARSPDCERKPRSACYCARTATPRSRRGCGSLPSSADDSPSRVASDTFRGSSMAEHSTVNRRVVGSSPTPGARPTRRPRRRRADRRDHAEVRRWSRPRPGSWRRGSQRRSREGGGQMKFGVFDHIDDGGRAARAAVEDRLRPAEPYDRAGFYAYHCAEHHGTPLGLAPSPSVLIASLAQRTTTAAPAAGLRLPLYDPLRLIEEICMLDHLSDGRLSWGSGAASRRSRPGSSASTWRAAARASTRRFAVILQGLTSDALDRHGRVLPLRGRADDAAPACRARTRRCGSASASREGRVGRGERRQRRGPAAGGMRAITDPYRAEWDALGRPPRTSR